jgi:hypothetical protein
MSVRKQSVPQKDGQAQDGGENPNIGDRPNWLMRVLEWLRERPWRILLALLAVVGIVVLIGIWYKSMPPTLSVDCSFGEGATSYEAVVYDSFETPEAQFLLGDQVIVTGPTSKVSETVARYGLTAIRECSLSYKNAHNLDLGSFPFQPKELRDLTMGLYQIGAGQSVIDVVKAIKNSGDHILADPNYPIGLLGLGERSCGNPNPSIGGSPNPSIGGSPNPSIGGSPIGLPNTAAAKLFWDQWAFEQIGVGPSSEGILDGNSVNPTGSGVRVGIFDTSPFEPALAAATVDSEGTIHFSEQITWITPTLRLSVTQPLAASSVPTYTSVPTQDIRDHGLFVASLIHAMAPESEIQLIRILDEYGCGRLFALNEALFRFIAKMEKDRGTLDGVVINLSLGVQKPRTDMQVTVQNDNAEGVQNEGVYTRTVKIDQSLTVLVEDTVESLQAALLLAHERGAVVVAAAGNDSFVEAKPLSPQLPAAYLFVIGVAASNVRRERACFSNWGDVSAPGGDGGPNDELKTKLLEGLQDKGFTQAELDYAQSHFFDCLPRTDTDKCLDAPGSCDDVLIGLTDYSHRGYSYWSGSSFSAPLVSGLAALILDAGVSRPTCPLLSPAWVQPSQVFDAIRCGAPTGDGVINVPATIFRCLPEFR